MNPESQTLKSNWILFLEKFSDSQIKISIEKNEHQNNKFIIENILETGIEISNSYGFLSVKFKNLNKRDEFLQHTEINYTIQDFEKHKLISTNWLEENYPCRVYVSDTGKILSFYDIKNNVNDDENFENRIVVFKNILSAIVNLKIAEAVSSTKDTVNANFSQQR